MEAGFVEQMPIKVKVRVANVLIVGFLLEGETPSLILGDCSGHLAGFSVVIINITISNNISIIMTIIKIIPLSFSAQEKQPMMPSLIRRTRRRAGPKSQSPDCQVLVARKGHQPG